MGTNGITINMKIIKKAYEIDLCKIESSCYLDCYWCHAETRNQARKILFDKASSENLKLDWTEEELSYLNIPVIRIKSMDLIEFEGEEMNRNEVANKIYKQKRIAELDAILKDENVKFCYIEKNGSLYKSNYCGYTDFHTRAGVYTKQDAINRAKSCLDISIEPINIKIHNGLLLAEIKDLQKRLIPT